MKVYFEYDGVKYFGYDIYLSCPRSYLSSNNAFLAGHSLAQTLDNEDIDSLLDDSFVPELGSEIHIVAPCPYSMDDVRKNYKIKRGLDSGCCNVFSPIKSYNWALSAYAFAISLSDKSLYVINEYIHDGKYITRLKGMVSNANPNATSSNVIYVDFTKNNSTYDSEGFYIIRSGEAYEKLMNGELTKPCISYKKLQFTNCNELTMDQIDLLYKTARMTNYSDVPNFILQLEALNQCNWREYPRSLTILWGIIRNVPAPAYWFVKNHISTQKKVVKEILNTQPADKANSKKDYDFAKSIIDHFLGVENVRFTKANTLIKKLEESGVGLDVFSEFYDNMIRLTPKEYNEENNDTVQ